MNDTMTTRNPHRARQIIDGWPTLDDTRRARIAIILGGRRK
ncbi:hypothetical protein [Oerskovia paurometabola]